MMENNNNNNSKLSQQLVTTIRKRNEIAAKIVMLSQQYFEETLELQWINLRFLTSSTGEQYMKALEDAGIEFYPTKILMDELVLEVHREKEKEK